MRNIAFYAPAGLVVAAHGAAAMELDTLLPAGIPGLGAAAPLTVIGRLQGQDRPVPIQLGGFTLAPAFAAGLGYDSAPSGRAAGTENFNAAPSLIVTDIPAGFGAYIAGNTQLLAGEPGQDTAGYTAAAGEEAVFPRETISVSGGIVRSTQTGFGLNTLGLSKPIAFTAAGLNLGDKFLAGMFTLKPEISFTTAKFDSLAAEDVSQFRGSTGIDYAPGGPFRVVSRFEATQSSYRAKNLNAQSYAALLGIDEDATGLWEYRILAGAAWRVPAPDAPASTAARAAPVLEAAGTWAPSELDTISADAAREIDDPDQIGPAGYTLTQADLSYTHETGGGIDLTGTFKAANAAYFGTGLNETLFNAAGTIAWHLNAALAVNISYAFNDRQANFLRAANENIITFNAVFTP
jgi:hypothetical protein